MGIWKTQLLVHRDEATEQRGLDKTGLPKLSLLQSAQILGWWRQQRGALLDRKWWRIALTSVLQKANKVGWSAQTPLQTNKRVWAALGKVAKDLDRLAPAGQLSADDALEPAAARRIPGMLVDLKGQKGVPSPLPPLPKIPLAAIAATKIKKQLAKAPGIVPKPNLPVIDPDKIPRPRLPQLPRFKLGGLSLFLILALIAVKAKPTRRK